MEPRPGTQLGDYRVVETIGRGGMGVVVRVEDARGGQVAIKLVLDEPAPSNDASRRLEREARAAQRIRHPNVVELRDVGEHEGRTFLVFELVQGGSLRARLSREGRLPWREAAARGAEIASALAAIHAAALVHRDVKPDNVLLDENGRAKLSDFGLVKRLEASELSRLSKTGEPLGTPAYMAPEQQGGLGEVGAPADLYALGATLYHLVAGEPPFVGEGFALLAKHLREKPASLRERVPDVPEALDELVLGLLAKDPRARAPNAAEASRVLDRIARAGTSRARSRVSLALAGAGAALFVLALGAALVSERSVRRRAELRARVAWTRGEVPASRAAEAIAEVRAALSSGLLDRAEEVKPPALAVRRGPRAQADRGSRAPWP